MTDREKIIKGLECCMNDGSECYEPSNGKCPYYKDDVSESTSTCTDDLFYDIYALLKAQEPGRVYITNCASDGGWSEGDCPFCGMRLDIFYNRSFCGTCGRAVEWE